MGINILLWEGMGMLLYITMRMGWGWEYVHGNGRKWDRKCHTRISLDDTQIYLSFSPELASSTFSSIESCIKDVFLDDRKQTVCKS